VTDAVAAEVSTEAPPPEPISPDQISVHPVVMIPVALIRLNPYNSNVMDPAQFNALVDKMVQIGIHGAVQVRRLTDEEKLEGEPYEFEMVGGEHRLKAAQLLHLEELPANVFDGPEWDRDRAEAEGVAMNVIHGSLDPLRFTAQYNRLAGKYGPELTRQMMGFASDALFRSVYRKTRDQLPPDLQKSLDKSKKDMKTVDDLSIVLHELMAKYGSTVDRSYMFFRYGGKQHAVVWLTPPVKKILDQLTERSSVEQVDINDLFGPVLAAGMKAVWADVVGDALEQDPVESAS
jgi:hypothetical protein